MQVYYMHAVDKYTRALGHEFEQNTLHAVSNRWCRQNTNYPKEDHMHV